MAYPDDLIGKYIENPIGNRVIDGEGLTKRQGEGLATDLTRPLTRVVHPQAPAQSPAPPPLPGARPPLVRQPAFTGPPWSYLLLEYVPGLVTATTLSPTGILTGWMSGCYLFRYTLGGQKYIAHVGTDVASADKSAKAKKIWIDFADNSGATEIMGGNPARDVPIATAAKAAGQFKPLVSGYFAPNGAARILTFGQGLHETAQRFYCKVLAMDALPLSPWSEIRKTAAAFKDDD